MSRTLRKLFLLALVVGAMILVTIGVVYEVAKYSLNASTEFKKAHTGTGTVVSTAKSSPRGSDATYTLCFTLDDWGNLPNSWKPEYEAAERERYRTGGPRCQRFYDCSVASKLNPGDKIQVTYLLENNLVIDIPRIRAFGVELDSADMMGQFTPCASN